MLYSPMSREVVVNEKDTAAYKVFKWPYEVLIPASYAVSEYEITQMGTPTTGDRKYDAELASEKSHTYRTIAQLAMLHSQGCEIMLVNPRRDAPAIFDITQAFLMEWANEINKSFHVEIETPAKQEKMARVLQDIELIESFVQSVYPTATRVLPAAMKTSTLASKLAQLTNMKLKLAPTVTINAPEKSANAPSPFTENLNTVGQDKVRRWAVKE